MIEYFADFSEKTGFPDIYNSNDKSVPFEETPEKFQTIMKKEFEMSI